MPSDSFRVREACKARHRDGHPFSISPGRSLDGHDLFSRSNSGTTFFDGSNTGPRPHYSLSLSSFSYSLFILSLSSSHAVLSLHLLHECTSIKRVLQKINRGGPARRHAASGESVAGSGWNSFTKKFRCKFKPQVCDCCGGGVAAEQGCGRYTISLKDTSSKEIGVRRLQNIIAPVFAQEHSLPGGINGGSTAEGYWMGADQSYYYQAQRASSYYYEPQPQIETLPLFPVRSGGR